MRGRKHKLFLLDGAFFEWDVEKAELNVRKHGVTLRKRPASLEMSMAGYSPIPIIPGMNQGFFLSEYRAAGDY